jgi:hypothetical protein
MEDPKPKKVLEADVLEHMLPLVLEILPGQASEGLIDVYQPGSYEGRTLRKLCDKVLLRKNLTLEEQQILEDIDRQLNGGRLLCRGHGVDSMAIEYAVVEQTEAGEKYLYVPIRAIRPQEGGAV